LGNESKYSNNTYSKERILKLISFKREELITKDVVN